MALPPAGDPTTRPTTCLQCPQPIGPEDDYYWLGYGMHGEEREGFWGYFCSETCRTAFSMRNEGSRLLALFHSPEAIEQYLAVLHRAIADGGTA